MNSVASELMKLKSENPGFSNKSLLVALALQCGFLPNFEQILIIEQSTLSDLNSIEILAVQLFGDLRRTASLVEVSGDLFLDTTTTAKQHFDTGIQLVVRGLVSSGISDVSEIIFDGASSYINLPVQSDKEILVKGKIFKIGAWIWHRVILNSLGVPIAGKIAHRIIPVARSLSNKLSNFRGVGNKSNGNFIPLGSRLLLAEVPNDPKHLLLLEVLAKFKIVRLEVLLHDLIPLTHPHLCPKDPEGNFLRFLHVVLHAERVVCISNDVMSKYLHFQGMNRSSNKDQLVVSHSYVTSPLLAACSQINTSESVDSNLVHSLDQRPFFLCPGGFSPRKNLQLILASMKILDTEIDYTLVVTGHQLWGKSRVKTELEFDELVTARVLIAPDVSKREMFWLLNNCVAVLYPSLAEGFGLPILEGRLVGAKVVCLDVPPMNAIDDQVIKLNNTSLDWAKKLKELLEYRGISERFKIDLNHVAEWENWVQYFIEGEKPDESSHFSGR